MGKKRRIRQIDELSNQASVIINRTYKQNMEESIQTAIIMGHTQAYEYLYNNYIKSLDNALLSPNERTKLLESLYRYVKNNHELRTGKQSI